MPVPFFLSGSIQGPRTVHRTKDCGQVLIHYHTSGRRSDTIVSQETFYIERWVKYEKARIIREKANEVVHPAISRFLYSKFIFNPHLHKGDFFQRSRHILCGEGYDSNFFGLCQDTYPDRDLASTTFLLAYFTSASYEWQFDDGTM